MVLVLHINGTGNPVPCPVLQKTNSGSGSENQIWFQLTQTGTSGQLWVNPRLALSFRFLFPKILVSVLVMVPQINRTWNSIPSLVLKII